MTNADFYKHNGCYTEGFLSDKEHFNGVLLLLREPNTKEADGFWFKDGTTGNLALYQNKFNIYLEYLEGTYDLADCAFANIRPQNGEAFASKAYKELQPYEKCERYEELVKACGNSKLKYVFTCSDIFDAICKTKEIKPSLYSKIQYKDVGKKFRMVEIDGITIYEIYHPSYRKYPEHPGEDFNK